MTSHRMALVACLALSATPLLAASEPEEVSLVQLIARPDDYHGKLVRVIGFCRLEFEGNALYLHKEDFEQAILKNSVWLDLGWPVPEWQRNLSDGYVLVEAVFDGKRKGHMSASSGMLTDIRRIERWRSRAEIERMLPLHRSNPPSPKTQRE